MDHNSIESCRMNWSGTGEFPRAGQAMSKAIHALGLTCNAVAGVQVGIITHPHDSYHLDVPTRRVDELVAELWKDVRVIGVLVDGTKREKPKVQKTAEEVQAEFDAFKKQVVTIAMKKAKEHDWCGVVKDALSEMGLDIPKNRARVVLEFEVDEDFDPSDATNTIYDLDRDNLREAIVTTELTEG